MTRLIAPNVTGEDKTEYAQQAIKAAELARQLHNVLHQMSRRDITGIAMKERMTSIEALEGELLEHAMRVTLGM